ncbi:hypothetical protein ANCCEY_00447 [Ancylostoma ceylanicum]|uniref:Cysteine rich repeat-containing domain protein n=2 Tax=Ancylostoma ceylanicum TaxID=53326 RepID=A0A0D6M8U3_9BILA|nr:hypothetical protein ANCCEY_00447 [Ancylostoma ceylanicum]EYC40744.1 hypothetical protein Y032_0599g473 [Ancylostoma ceylanicum]
MLTVLVFGLVQLAALTEQQLLGSCPCAQLAPNVCSCHAGHSPLCSCQPIVPTPSCGCGVQAQVSHCQSSCLQTCQSTCSQSRLSLACPSLCGNTCGQSCMPVQALSAPVLPRLVLPGQCSSFCEQSCLSSCAAHPIPSVCVPSCFQTCQQKCAVAVPALVPAPQCMDACMPSCEPGCLMEHHSVALPMQVPL